jgi:hypothetical protein
VYAGFTSFAQKVNGRELTTRLRGSGPALGSLLRSARFALSILFLR